MKHRIDASARLIGRVRLGDGAYVAQGAVLRSEQDSLSVGNDSWVLENSVLIGTGQHPLRVGSKTVFGHKCLAIGTTIGDLCEIGNGVIFLPGSVIGDQCIFGEGTLIEAGQTIPSGSVVVGRPGRIIRSLSPQDRDMIKRMRGGDISLIPLQETLFDEPERTGQTMATCYPFAEKFPQVHPSALLYDSAEITGDVQIGEGCVIASGVRIIGNAHGPVRIGNHVQIMENTVLHLLPDNELIIHDHVSIGPGCIIHGTTIGAHSVIEAGAIVCDYSTLGEHVLVRAGSLVKQRMQVEDHTEIDGFPGKPVAQHEHLTKPEWAVRR